MHDLYSMSDGATLLGSLMVSIYQLYECL